MISNLRKYRHYQLEYIYYLVSRTGIFHVLFALFFLTLTITILQILSYQHHYTRFIPFRLFTLFTDIKKDACIDPIT